MGHLNAAGPLPFPGQARQCHHGPQPPPSVTSCKTSSPGRSLVKHLLHLALIPFVLSDLSAQMAWEKLSFPRGAQIEMCYDSARKRVVAVGMIIEGVATSTTYLTWEWDGKQWEQKSSVAHPHVRVGTGLAYDSQRGVTVLFGGGFSRVFGDTWEWDGTHWKSRVTATQPAKRAPYALAYDEARGVTVMFGGWTGTALLDDTWEYDGTDWRQRHPAAKPPAMARHTLTYDPVRKVTVMSGGEDAVGSYSTDTWEWDGTTWHKRTPATSPPGRREHAACYDPSRGAVVIHGGQNGHYSGYTDLNDTWEWDGVSWTQRGAASAPYRVSHALVFDPGMGRTLLYGGTTPTSPEGFRELLLWDGTAWTPWRDAGPENRYGAATGYDPSRKRIVLFGGMDHTLGNSFLGDTWEWDGAHWSLRSQTGPEPGARGRLVPDATGRMIMFGGTVNTPTRQTNSTWGWDGTTWTRLQTPHPPSRWNHAIAYDAGRKRVVMFGGHLGSKIAADTWEWDGYTWLQRLSSNTPGPRVGHAMEYDAARQQLILFGGYAANVHVSDTWTWDGVDWKQLSPATTPPARWHHSLVYDSNRQRIVMVGGRAAAYAGLDDTWEWDGTDWHQSVAGPGRTQTGAAYDAANGVLHAICGEGYRRGGRYLLDDWWTYTPTVRHTTSSYGAGCAASRGVPTLSVDGPPIVGNQDFSYKIGNAAASTIASVSFGLSKGNTHVPGCCTLYVDTFLGSLATVTDTNGSARVPAQIPWDPAMHGVAVYAQGFIVDASGTCWSLASATAGRKFIIGD